MFNKLKPYIAYIITALISGIVGYALHVFTHTCPHIVSEVTVLDTVYLEVPEMVTSTKPVTKWRTEYETIEVPGPRWEIIHDTTEGRIDTFTKVVFKEREATFVSQDTLRNDSLWVAVTDSANCLGILSRSSVWGGKYKAVNTTTTKTIDHKDKALKYFAGANFRQQPNMPVNMTVNSLVLYKDVIGFEYNRGRRSNTFGLKVRIK